MTARLTVILALVLAPAAAGAARPEVALTASPSHLALTASGRASIRVLNPGTRAVVVDVAPAGLAVGLRGRPRALLAGAGARGAAARLAVRPRVLRLGPGSSGVVSVAARPRRVDGPGDHPALVLLTTRPPAGGRLAVRMRIGITTVVHVSGAIRRSLALRSLRVRGTGARRAVEVVVANRGNVVERLWRGRLTVVLVSRGRVVARLRSAPRELLPGSRGAFELAYRGRIRGRLTARVALAAPEGRVATLRRSYRVRL